MVAHSGFITVARKVEPGLLAAGHGREMGDETLGDEPEREGRG
jgi:hypothetical protein